MNTNFLTIVLPENMSINEAILSGRQQVVTTLPLYVNIPGAQDLYKDPKTGKSDWSIFGFSTKADTQSDALSTLAYLKHVYATYRGGLVIVSGYEEVTDYINAHGIGNITFVDGDEQAAARANYRDVGGWRLIVPLKPSPEKKGEMAHEVVPLTDVIFGLTRVSPCFLFDEPWFIRNSIMPADTLVHSIHMTRLNGQLSVRPLKDFPIAEGFKVPSMSPIDVSRCPDKEGIARPIDFYNESCRSFMDRCEIVENAVWLDKELWDKPDDTVVVENGTVFNGQVGYKCVVCNVTQPVTVGMFKNIILPIVNSKECIDESDDTDQLSRLTEVLLSKNYAERITVRNLLDDKHDITLSQEK